MNNLYMMLPHLVVKRAKNSVCLGDVSYLYDGLLWLYRANTGYAVFAETNSWY